MTQHLKSWSGTLFFMISILSATGFSPFGRTIEGSEQLEAWLSFECAEGVQPCRHAVDPRKIYKHTHPGYPEPSLGVGPHAYLSATVSTVVPDEVEIFVHQGTWSTDAASAIAHVRNATGSALLMTQSCKTDLFASVLHITILTPTPGKFDFSFTVKKAILKVKEPSVHMISPKVPVLLAIPILAITANGGQGHDVSVTITETFPPNSTVSIAFAGATAQCAASPSPFPHAAANPSTSAWGRVRVPDGDATHAFVSVLADAPKRVLVTLAVTVQPVEGMAGRGAEGEEEEREEAYLRALLLGDRLRWRLNLHDALAAYRTAQGLAPSKGGAAARILQLLHQGGGLKAEAGGGGGEEGGSEMENGLYPLVQELGEALRAGLAPLASGRASAIRKVLSSQASLLAMARRAVAETLAEDGDLHAANRLLQLSLLDHAHLPAEASFQPLWETAMFMKRFGAWELAAEHLAELARIDTGSGEVQAELAATLLLLRRPQPAKAAAQAALALEAGHARAQLSLAHALLMEGCGGAAQAAAATLEASKAPQVSEEEEELGRALRSLALLCQQRRPEALAAQYRVGGYAELELELGAAEAAAAACARLSSICSRLLLSPPPEPPSPVDAAAAQAPADPCALLACSAEAEAAQAQEQ